MRVAKEIAVSVAVVVGVVLLCGRAVAKSAVLRDGQDGVHVTYYAGGSSLDQYYPLRGYRYSVSPASYYYYGAWRPLGYRYRGYANYPYSCARYPYGVAPYEGCVPLGW
jgi:hypothetical protein